MFAALESDGKGRWGNGSFPNAEALEPLGSKIRQRWIVRFLPSAQNNMLTKEQKEKVTSIAKNLVGVPYVYGASPDKAPAEFDCSSFVLYLYKQIGFTLPRSTILQAADPQSKEVESASNHSNLEAGDLLFMRGPQGHYNDELFPDKEVCIGHMVMYLGSDEIIHAKQSNGVVTIEKLSDFIKIPKYGIVLVKRY